MSKIKLVLAGFVFVVGITGAVVVYMIVSSGAIKKDVEALKGWQPPEGSRIQRIYKKKKKLRKISKVLKHKGAATPHVLEALKAWPPAEAKGVMVTMGLLRSPEGIPALVDIIKKDEGEGGLTAAAALSWYKEKAEAALKDLGSGVSDHSPAVRTNIYRSLGWSKVDSLLETIAAGLQDSDENVAITVGNLLKSRKSDILVPPLLGALESSSEGLSSAASKGLIHNLKSLKPKMLEKPLSSSTEHVQANALQVLGHMDRAFVSRIVEPYLENDSAVVSIAAAEALAKMGEKFKLEKVLRHLESADAEACKRTVAVLKEKKADAFQGQYTTLLTHAQIHTRIAAAELLTLCAKSNPGYHTDNPSVLPLIDLLEVEGATETAANTLRVMTREHGMDDNSADWKKWYKRISELESRLKVARTTYTKIKKWLGGDEIHEEGRPQEAVDLIDKAVTMYEEIENNNLSRRGWDNEIQKLMVLRRQAMTHLMD
ncbi:MAG: HEAT repeat domain-containing protein [Planctomycetota bacterium]|jgi:hypothetical protein